MMLQGAWVISGGARPDPELKNCHQDQRVRCFDFCSHPVTFKTGVAASSGRPVGPSTHGCLPGHPPGRQLSPDHAVLRDLLSGCLGRLGCNGLGCLHRARMLWR